MRRAASTLTLTLLLCAPALPAAAGKADKAVEKPVRTLISAVRYGKDDLAVRHLAGEKMGEGLLGDAWSTGTPAQKKEFVSLFHGLFAGIAFPKIRKNFEHLETIVYAGHTAEGDTAKMDSTIVILHPVKKVEYKVTYDLRREGGAWKVLDFTVHGTGRASMLTNIKKEQIDPIMEEGGWDHLLGLMRKRTEEVKAAGEK